MAQGEYLAPEKVENVYGRSPLVAQTFVYGDSFRSQLVAIVVPDPEALIPWAAARKLPQDLKQLCEHKVVIEAVLRSMQEQGRGAKLKGFEQVRPQISRLLPSMWGNACYSMDLLCAMVQPSDALGGCRCIRNAAGHEGLACCLQVAAVTLTPDPFSVENGMLTPTFKLKRPQAKQTFIKAIEAMYKGLD